MISKGAGKFWDQLLVWLPFYWLLQADTFPRKRRTFIHKYVQLKISLLNQVISLYTISLNIHKFYIVPTEHIYVFYMVLKTIIEYFPAWREWTFFVTEKESF